MRRERRQKAQPTCFIRLGETRNAWSEEERTFIAETLSWKHCGLGLPPLLSPPDSEIHLYPDSMSPETDGGREDIGKTYLRQNQPGEPFLWGRDEIVKPGNFRSVLLSVLLSKW